MYSVRVSARGEGNNLLEGVLTILLTDGNDVPTRVTLSAESVGENLPVGTLVALLSCEDEDILDNCVYDLEGDLASIVLFDVQGNRLYTQTVFNAEQRRVYAFDVRATDKGGSEVVSPVVLQIADQNDTPVFSSVDLRIREDASRGAMVGLIAATDEDEEQSLTYSLVSGGENAAHTSNYEIDSRSGELFLAQPDRIDYEEASVHLIDVLVEDDGRPVSSVSRTFEVQIIDVAEDFLPAPNVISPNGDGINDFWEIRNSEIYLGMELVIFNEYGQVIYTTKSYNNDWNGMYNGSPLSRGVYYYIMYDRNRDVAYRGSISVVR